MHDSSTLDIEIALSSKRDHYKSLIARAKTDDGRQAARDWIVGYIARDNQFKRLIREQNERDKRIACAARQMHIDQEGLVDAITKRVMPSLVRIETPFWSGIGFYQHPEWMVSNAHVLPASEFITESKFYNVNGTELKYSVESSYHRPTDKNNVPDLVVLKTIGRALESGSGLATAFCGDLANTHEETHIFYVEFNTKTKTHTLKFLRQLSKPESYPVVYVCEDGSVPEPGCSGSPVIEARVVKNREPYWHFSMVGTVYARCDVAWYNANQKIKTVDVSDQTKLACVIPVDQDFEAILNILHAQQNQIRSHQLAGAHSAFIQDEATKRRRALYFAREEESRVEAESSFLAFEAGETVLDIAIPDGLEKLLGPGIADFKDSLLTDSGRKSLSDAFLRKNQNISRTLKRLPCVSSAVLKSEFEEFITEKVQNKTVFELKDRKTLYSKNEWLRLDITGGGKSGKWIVQIQDNTGMGFQINGRTASSTFSSVEIPARKGPEEHTIAGAKLATELQESQKIKHGQEIGSGAADVRQQRRPR
jgi:hypothetical protein